MNYLSGSRNDSPSKSHLDSMEKGQVDQEDVAVTAADQMSHIMQDVKGQKVLATPAVRRLALENKVRLKGDAVLIERHFRFGSSSSANIGCITVILEITYSF